MVFYPEKSRAMRFGNGGDGEDVKLVRRCVSVQTPQEIFRMGSYS